MVSESSTAVAVAHKNSVSKSWWVWLQWWQSSQARPSFFPPSRCRVTWSTTWAWAIICSHWILSSCVSARKAPGPLPRWRWPTLILTVWKSECLKALQSQKNHWNAVWFISTEEAGPWEAQVCPGHLQVVWGCGLPWVRRVATKFDFPIAWGEGDLLTCFFWTVLGTLIVPAKLLAVSPFYARRCPGYILTPYIKVFTYLLGCLFIKANCFENTSCDINHRPTNFLWRANNSFLYQNKVQFHWGIRRGDYL